MGATGKFGKLWRIGLEFLKGVGPEKLVDRDLALHFGKLKDKFGQGGLSCSLRSYDVKKRGTKD